MKEISVEDLKTKIDQKESFTLLDVRDPFELHISNLDYESITIPMDELSSRVDELDESQDIIVMCRSGSRSGTACEFLEKKGFSNVINLKGGINDWAKKIDPKLPVY